MRTVFVATPLVYPLLVETSVGAHGQKKFIACRVFLVHIIISPCFRVSVFVEILLVNNQKELASNTHDPGR